jgi:hypothetical protein
MPSLWVGDSGHPSLRSQTQATSSQWTTSGPPSDASFSRSSLGATRSSERSIASTAPAGSRPRPEIMLRTARLRLRRVSRRNLSRVFHRRSGPSRLRHFRCIHGSRHPHRHLSWPRHLHLRCRPKNRHCRLSWQRHLRLRCRHRNRRCRYNRARLPSPRNHRRRLHRCCKQTRPYPKQPRRRTRQPLRPHKRQNPKPPNPNRSTRSRQRLKSRRSRRPRPVVADGRLIGPSTHLPRHQPLTRRPSKPLRHRRPPTSRPRRWQLN